MAHRFERVSRTKKCFCEYLFVLDWPPIEYYRRIDGQVRTRSENIVHLVDYFEEMENIDRVDQDTPIAAKVVAICIIGY